MDFLSRDGYKSSRECRAAREIQRPGISFGSSLSRGKIYCCNTEAKSWLTSRSRNCHFFSFFLNIINFANTLGTPSIFYIFNITHIFNIMRIYRRYTLLQYPHSVLDTWNLLSLSLSAKLFLIPLTQNVRDANKSTCKSILISIDEREICKIQQLGTSARRSSSEAPRNRDESIRNRYALLRVLDWTWKTKRAYVSSRCFAMFFAVRLVTGIPI